MASRVDRAKGAGGTRGASRGAPTEPSGPAALGKNLKSVGGPGTVGLEIVVGLMLGLFGGQWLDARLGSAPAFTLLGITLGLGAGVRGLVRAHRSMQREAREEEAAHGNPRPAYPYEDEQREDEQGEREQGGEVDGSGAPNEERPADATPSRGETPSKSSREGR